MFFRASPPTCSKFSHGYATVGDKSPPITSDNVKSEPNKSELYKYPWYHGGITREAAETLTITNGDFLLRDSISQPGDYVLTCCWDGVAMHFVVNKQKMENGKIQYRFEECLFDRVAELIHFYVSKKKPISSTSGAIISAAVPRSNLFEGPHYHHSYHHRSAGHSPQSSPHASPRPSPFASPITSPATVRRSRTGSHPLSLSSGGEESDSEQRTTSPRCFMRSVSQQSPQTVRKPKRNTLPHVYSEPLLKSQFCSVGLDEIQKHKARRPTIDITQQFMNRQQPTYATIVDDPDKTPTNPQGHGLELGRSFSKRLESDADSKESTPLSSFSEKLSTTTNPISSRPRITIRNHKLYEDDGKDYSDYEQVKSWPAVKEARQRQLERENSEIRKYSKITRKPAITTTKEPRDTYDIPPSAPVLVASIQDENSTPVCLSLEELTITLPPIDPPSCFSLENFCSALLPQENPPLDNQTMSSVKAVIASTSPSKLASHLTFVDIHMMRLSGEPVDFGVRLTSTFELLIVQQGSRLRHDILER